MQVAMGVCYIPRYKLSKCILAIDTTPDYLPDYTTVKAYIKVWRMKATVFSCMELSAECDCWCAFGF